MTPNVTPTLDELISLVARGDRSTEAGPIPAQVTAYDSATQTCDAQPLVLLPVDGELRAAPIVRQAQVLWPSGATWSLVGPMAVGDLVWLIPAGADIGQWKASNAAQSLAATLRRGSLSDVVALPGSRPLTSPLPSTAFDATATVLAATLIKLGDSTATKAVGLHGDEVQKGVTDLLYTWMTQVETAINVLAPGSITPLSTTFAKVGSIEATATKVMAK